MDQAAGFEAYREIISRINPDTDAACPVQSALELFSNKWTLRVLYELTKNDSLRFGQLRRQIPGITNTMLSTTLKSLERKDLLIRTQYNEIPPHTEYRLSEKGKGLYIVFLSIMDWSQRYGA